MDGARLALVRRTYRGGLGVDLAVAGAPGGGRAVLEEAAPLAVHEPGVAHLLLGVELEARRAARLRGAVGGGARGVGLCAVGVAVEVLGDDVHRDDRGLLAAGARGRRGRAGGWRRALGNCGEPQRQQQQHRPRRRQSSRPSDGAPGSVRSLSRDGRPRDAAGRAGLACSQQ